MNRRQLATLLSWAGETGLQGRKRLQKVVYFLQQAGCKLNCEYTLHHFGPYSRDVAEICDEMVAAGLIEESAGSQYSYKLMPRTEEFLKQAQDEQMNLFSHLGKELLVEKNWTLELGSTIHFYYRQLGNWEQALKEACAFKKVPDEGQSADAALSLAKRFVDQMAPC
ncbi:MAG: hypothetical protein MUC43_18065 [Pirellula sp.]|jgi:uncharacterized protein YwgA|nr:hypothetical protein [Pirellula sp.]